jgi:hypothetical protein
MDLDREYGLRPYEYGDRARVQPLERLVATIGTDRSAAGPCHRASGSADIAHALDLSFGKATTSPPGRDLEPADRRRAALAGARPAAGSGTRGDRASAAPSARSAPPAAGPRAQATSGQVSDARLARTRWRQEATGPCRRPGTLERCPRLLILRKRPTPCFADAAVQMAFPAIWAVLLIRGAGSSKHRRLTRAARNRVGHFG